MKLATITTAVASLSLSLILYSQTRVQVCHKGRTLTISENGVKGHLNHGDTEGPCSTPNNPPSNPPTPVVTPPGSTTPPVTTSPPSTTPTSPSPVAGSPARGTGQRITNPKYTFCKKLPWIDDGEVIEVASDSQRNGQCEVVLMDGDQWLGQNAFNLAKQQRWELEISDAVGMYRRGEVKCTEPFDVVVTNRELGRVYVGEETGCK